MKTSLRLALVLLGSSLPLSAQIGDKLGEAQVPLVPAALTPAAPPLSPEEELKSFQVAPGYRVELVASEPLIGDPVAMAFGADGRLWVVEMRSYMPHLDGHGEDQPTGRVVVLSDRDGDGRMDQSEVFLDGLIMPRAITLAHGGVLIGAPPKLWFCRDTNNDGRADEKIEVANDYGIQVDPSRPELANPERAPNSLLWALDNWIYSGAYTAKFRYRQGQWERAATTFRGQWGLSQDDWGHLFHNSNSDQLRADLIASHYLGRNPNLFRPSGSNVKVATEQWVWPVRVNPGINRGYRPEMLREFKLKEFTAACAPWIYRGDLFPSDAYGNAFICEPAGNLIKRNLLRAEGGSLQAKEAYPEREFLASTDERFRPVNLATGPEGALYVVDFYRGVIQHRISLTTYLRQQIESRGLDKPIGLGRIWRIVPEGKERPAAPSLAKQSPDEWVQALAHPNGWRRETAQRLLVEAGKPEQIPAIEAMALNPAQPLGCIHALWTLDGLQSTRWPVIAKALGSADPRVRAAALRVSESLLASAARPELLAKWIALSRTETSPEVQLQVALSLGEAREASADLALAALAARAPGNPHLRDAVLTGLHGRELELLERLLAATEPQNEPLLTGLARCVLAERKPARITQLLTALGRHTNSARRQALLNGMATHPVITVKNPVKFPSEPSALTELLNGADKPMAAAAGKFVHLLTWPGKPGAPVEVPIVPLTAEQQGRFEVGKQLFAGVCAACHQPHGLGMEGLAPPLVDSEWVVGSPERLSRIVLHGVRGPIKVKGIGYTLDMPGLGVFDDQQIASILTYIRREWGHGASPVEPAAVQAIRAAHVKRQDAWTEAELLKVP